MFLISSICLVFSLLKIQKDSHRSKYTTRTFNPLSANPAKWSNTLKQFIGKLPTNCLSVFDRFVGLALKGLKVAAAKKHFPQRVFYWYILLRWIFFIQCNNWKTLFFIKVYRYSKVFLMAMLLLSLKQVSWNKYIFYRLSP